MEMSGILIRQTTKAVFGQYVNQVNNKYQDRRVKASPDKIPILKIFLDFFIYFLNYIEFY